MRFAVAAAVVLVAAVGRAQAPAPNEAAQGSGFSELLAREKAELATLQEQMQAAHSRLAEEHQRWLQEQARAPHADPDYQAFAQRHAQLIEQHAQALAAHQALVARFLQLETLAADSARSQRVALAAELASAQAEQAALVSDHEQMAEQHISWMRRQRLAVR